MARVGLADSTAAVPGYLDYAAYSRQVADLERTGRVRVQSLAKTLGGRDVYLLTVGVGDRDSKPAILVLGNVRASHLVGSELTLRMAKALAEEAERDAEVKALLERVTFYFIPRPNPDGSEAFFQRPHRERDGNLRPTDDDRDGTIGEDPAEDLNGDGQITMIRVLDERGTFLPHPDEPRVMIEASAAKGERGRYSLYVEGRDNDHDEQFNEDGSGGVSFDRNFTFKYPAFQVAAGPHQVSEAETRAVADFAFARTNIAVVFTFTPQDNLLQTPKPNPAAEGARIKTTLLAADAPYVEALGDRYRRLRGGQDAPPPAAGAGSFSDWAYFHYGRWSLAARGWWIPRVDAKPADKSATPPQAEQQRDEKHPGGNKQPADDKRGSEEIQALRWFQQQGIEGFVAWTPIEHPDFPGRTVEVGGFKPFLRINPPAKELDALAQAHRQFLLEVARRLPQVSVDRVRVEALGGGVSRVTAEVVNAGFLPTMSEMGRISRQAFPLQLAIDLPPGATLVEGHLRTRLDRLAGSGGHREHPWVVRGTGPATVRAYAPAVGSHATTASLGESAKPSDARPQSK